VNNLAGKDKAWRNDSGIAVVGSNAIVRANEDKDFKGAEMAFAPRQQFANLGELDVANDIELVKITCEPS